MPRGSPELTTARREEIIAACAALYETTSFKEITIKEIGAATSFTRTSIEMNDPACRPAIAGELPDLTAYDTVLIGSPIWWGDTPRILSSFVERVDLTDKSLAVFFTSGSSGLGNSMKHLEQQAGAGTWLEGRRFNPRTTAEELRDWASGLGIEP
ncbi:MAG: NAD(P)H-dependent oxidoreductase [Clostridia bacterium]|nr:NAD(P)H-dependent oxidoreductase [Clostridia bacterium]